jgi:hypothetical protein
MFFSFQRILPGNLAEQTLLLPGGDCKAGSLAQISPQSGNDSSTRPIFPSQTACQNFISSFARNTHAAARETQAGILAAPGSG